MIQQTLVEELNFIHEHIEQIELRVDGIDQELKSIHVLMRQLLKVFDRMATAIENADG